MLFRSQLLHSDLHLLDVPQRVQYKLGVTMHRCLRHKAPQYLVDCCTSVAEVPGHRHLRSASSYLYRVTVGVRSALGLFLSLARGLRMHCQTFSGILRAAVTVSARHSRHSSSLNTDCMYSALEADAAMRYRNPRLTLTLTLTLYENSV